MDFCPNCGGKGVGAFEFCPSCGTRLPTSAAAAQQMQTATYWAQAEMKKGADRTKTGLLLLIVGSLLSLIPLVGGILGIVGGLMVLIGIILIIVGRKPFGPKHSRAVIVALILAVGAVAAAVVITMILAMSAIDLTTGTIDYTAMRDALVTVMWIGIPLAAVTGIANVLFVVYLESPTGRGVLFTAFAVSLITAAVGTYVMVDFVEREFSGGIDETRFGEFDSATLLLQTAISAPGTILFAIAYYIPHGRIQRGEIPLAQVQPAPLQGAPPPRWERPP